jgi:hypothetical protein
MGLIIQFRVTIYVQHGISPYTINPETTFAFHYKEKDHTSQLNVGLTRKNRLTLGKRDYVKEKIA